MALARFALGVRESRLTAFFKWKFIADYLGHELRTTLKKPLYFKHLLRATTFMRLVSGSDMFSRQCRLTVNISERGDSHVRWMWGLGINVKEQTWQS